MRQGDRREVHGPGKPPSALAACPETAGEGAARARARTQTLGLAPAPVRLQSLAMQSSWATSHRYDTESGYRFFVKVARGTDGTMFKGEALGLQAMYGASAARGGRCCGRGGGATRPLWAAIVLLTQRAPAWRRPPSQCQRPDADCAADTHTLRIPRVFHHGELSTLPAGTCRRLLAARSAQPPARAVPGWALLPARPAVPCWRPKQSVQPETSTAPSSSWSFWTLGAGAPARMTSARAWPRCTSQSPRWGPCCRATWQDRLWHAAAALA